MKKFTAEEIRTLLGQVVMGEITFSQMAEVLNERMSEGVCGRMEEMNEPQYKDGDFVVNECGAIIIFKNKVGNSIYDHAYFSESAWVVVCSDTPTATPIKGYATEEEKKKILDELAKEGKRWNTEKKCVEDIPKRKFKKGDKVRIKEGVSSKTMHGQYPVFQPSMDDFIGTTMTVNRYDDMYGYVICNESDWRFNEDWLEYTDELTEGDLAIFWDNEKEMAIIKPYGRPIGGEEEDFQHKDQNGFSWINAIKFESKEQFNRFIKGEI